MPETSSMAPRDERTRSGRGQRLPREPRSTDRPEDADRAAREAFGISAGESTGTIKTDGPGIPPGTPVGPEKWSSCRTAGVRGALPEDPFRPPLGDFAARSERTVLHPFRT